MRQVEVSQLAQEEEEQVLAAAGLENSKSLTAKRRVGELTVYLVESHTCETDHACETSCALYSGTSLENAVDYYNACAPHTPLVNSLHPSPVSVQDLIAKSESIPKRKAALDRARLRRALAAIAHNAIPAMTPAQASSELRKTKGGRAQYELIKNRATGTPYAPIRQDTSVPLEELIVGMCNTPEGRSAFEEVRLELREFFGLQGEGDTLITSLSKTALHLLHESRISLADGFESAGPLESDGSRADKALVARIDELMGNYLAKKLLKAT